MPLTLYVDGDRWRAHQRSVVASFPGIVPVCKGNGYGFGNARLAAEAQALGADLIAVGTYEEVPAAAEVFDGEILVLSPWRPFVEIADKHPVIHTASRLADLEALAEPTGPKPRVIIELLTSMRRHGIPAAELDQIAPLLDGVDSLGWALHLPLTTAGAHGAEVERWIGLLRAAGLPLERLFVSHVTSAELASLSAKHPELTIRPRIGTALWLKKDQLYRAQAHVLDVHPVKRGDRFGYRQRRVPGDGSIVVVAGGTANGIALEAPSHVADLRTRAKVLAASGLEAAGRALSPYTIAGRRRWFAEPPHQQVSMIFVPSNIAVPAVGDELDVNVGMTLTTFDRIVFS
ncbi:alanine racemase [Tenggerimyces flavus]|uniref:Alanine racemase n=1 Tax=Tenggerimyces flavus TaxID=1708749 RepID=A0ABV7YFF1_9ACTN|nr:alanine racemase [Tenggerimyces flavus]MBM7784312.1 alanine racemase [Tenggerimyces flavus]